jgi:hypothetical protein
MARGCCANAGSDAIVRTCHMPHGGRVSRPTSSLALAESPVFGPVVVPIQPSRSVSRPYSSFPERQAPAPHVHQCADRPFAFGPKDRQALVTTILESNIATVSRRLQSHYWAMVSWLENFCFLSSGGRRRPANCDGLPLLQDACHELRV